MVGRLAPWKGQELFLRAWAVVQERLAALGPDAPAATALVVGDALFAVDEAYAASLPALVDDLGLGATVTLPGWHPEVERLLADTDIAVHASTVAEPHGQVVVEAMAAGVAVIASAAGGPTELIDPGVDGVLVPPGDVEALADALVALIVDPDERRRLGERAAERVRTTADPAAAAATIVALYDRVARPRRR
jgi:glycosyltransferase involved in cell wall biosynthesis